MAEEFWFYAHEHVHGATTGNT